VADESGLRVRVLGRVGVGDAESVPIGAPRLAALLALLALRAGRFVSIGEVIDGVWGESAPASVRGSVYTYVSTLRKVLGRSALEGDRAGYCLNLGAEQVDALAAARWRARARELAAQGEVEAASVLVAQALALWRGEPLSGLPGPFAESERERLGELWWSLQEDRAELGLALMRPAEVAGELAGLVVRAPLRESVARLAMIALYRCGRAAEALALFGRVRTVLRAELGVDPGPGLSEVHEQVLRNAPALLSEPVAASALVTGPEPGEQPSSSWDAPAQLPHDVAGFTGRAQELMWLRGVVAAAQRERQGAQVLAISAIEGCGGIGKTALAVRFAHQVADLFPDGQLYVDLRGFHPNAEPLSAGDALGQLLFAAGAGGQGLPAEVGARAALFRSRLTDRRVLVVLDNAVDTAQVEPLLPGGAQAVVVVTSRNRLGGLVARHGARRLTLDVLTPGEGQALLERVVGVDRVAGELAAAQELVELCGRFPLAIRIAGEQVSERGEDALASLVTELRAEGARLDVLAVADDPSSAMRAVFAWSYRALPAEAAAMFRALSAHRGGQFGVEAAASAAGVAVGQARRVLRMLGQAHLIEQVAHDRYRIHDLLRVYAGEQAIAEDGPDAHQQAVSRVLEYYLAAAAAAFDAAMPGVPRPEVDPVSAGVASSAFAGKAAALGWYQREAGNLGQAVVTAAETGRARLGWQLATRLRVCYQVLDLPGAWFELLGVGIDCARRDANRSAEATLYSNRAGADRLDDRDRARADAHRAYEIFTELGDLVGAARALGNAAMSLYYDLERQQERLDELRQVLDLLIQASDRDGQARTWANLAEAYIRMGDWHSAIAAADEVTRLCENSNTEFPNSAYCKAFALVRLGRVEEALAFAEQALRRAEADGDPYSLRGVHEALADCYAALGDPETSLQHAELSMPRRAEEGLEGDSYVRCTAMASMARAKYLLGRRGEAQRLWDEALEHARQHGSAIEYDVQVIIDHAHELAVAADSRSRPLTTG
jgi:DNA-binding SARP family transcriptional activator/tetratricopeptide (TPR) repeat protein